MLCQRVFEHDKQKFASAFAKRYRIIILLNEEDITRQSWTISFSVFVHCGNHNFTAFTLRS